MVILEVISAAFPSEEMALVLLSGSDCQGSSAVLQQGTLDRPGASQSLDFLFQRPKVRG